MNERQLRSFVAAVEMKSLSKAAAASYISTPAFVQQINLLESGLGFKLLNRTSRGISMTPSGKIFYDAAVQILSLYEQACNACAALEEQAEHTLKIACPPEQLPTFVMQACRRMLEEDPSIRLDFVPSAFRQHLTDVADGKIDLAVMAEPTQEHLKGLTFFPLGRETFSFCMRPDHPLAEKEILTPDDLRRYPILCGKYEFLKYPFADCLPSDTLIRPLPDEYDNAARIRSQLSEELIIIHSHWANCYSNTLRVVPSEITAGQIGVVYRTPVGKLLNRFISLSHFNPNSTITDTDSRKPQ